MGELKRSDYLAMLVVLVLALVPAMYFTMQVTIYGFTTVSEIPTHDAALRAPPGERRDRAVTRLVTHHREVPISLPRDRNRGLFGLDYERVRHPSALSRHQHGEWIVGSPTGFARHF